MELHIKPRQPRRIFRRWHRQRRPEMPRVFVLMWIAGGVFGLFVGALIAQRYLGVDVLTPVEEWFRTIAR